MSSLQYQVQIQGGFQGLEPPLKKGKKEERTKERKKEDLIEK